MANTVIVKGKAHFVITDYDSGYYSGYENKVPCEEVRESFPEGWKKLQGIVEEDKKEVFAIFKEQTGAKSVDFEMDDDGNTKMTFVFDHDITDEDAEKLVEYTEGQYSDGWGEGLEQQELYTETETYTETEEDDEGEEYEEEYETEYILTFHLWMPNETYSYELK